MVSAEILIELTTQLVAVFTDPNCVREHSDELRAVCHQIDELEDQDLSVIYDAFIATAIARANEAGLSSQIYVRSANDFWNCWGLPFPLSRRYQMRDLLIESISSGDVAQDMSDILRTLTSLLLEPNASQRGR